ncbi:hypothetical protein T08_12846 [Trichinella sp. T8]|nr:hypothetical protein T08_12846 [Trichinella sp. T8]
MRSGNRTSVYTGQLVSAYICYGHLSDIPCYRCLGRKQWTIYLFVTTPKKSNGYYTEQRWLLFGFCIANEVSCKPIRAIFGLPLCVGHQTLKLRCRRILADSADMTTYCRKSAAAETKAGFVDALSLHPPPALNISDVTPGLLPFRRAHLRQMGCPSFARSIMVSFF